MKKARSLLGAKLFMVLLDLEISRARASILRKKFKAILDGNMSSISLPGADIRFSSLRRKSTLVAMPSLDSWACLKASSKVRIES